MKGLQISESGDIAVKNGDISIGEIDQDVIAVVLLASRGEFKEDLRIGANVRLMTHGSVDPFWASDTKLMLHRCGVSINQIRLSGNEITIS